MMLLRKYTKLKKRNRASKREYRQKRTAFMLRPVVGQSPDPPENLLEFQHMLNTNRTAIMLPGFAL